jgi:hypothetical protein
LLVEVEKVVEVVEVEVEVEVVVVVLSALLF